MQTKLAVIVAKTRLWFKSFRSQDYDQNGLDCVSRDRDQT